MRFGLDIAQQRMTFDEVISRAQFAESLGFDGVWGFDHFQPMYGEGPGECFEGVTTLAALSGNTSRVRLGLMVMGFTYRHPGVSRQRATKRIRWGKRVSRGSMATFWLHGGAEGWACRLSCPVRMPSSGQ